MLKAEALGQAHSPSGQTGAGDNPAALYGGGNGTSIGMALLASILSVSSIFMEASAEPVAINCPSLL